MDDYLAKPVNPQSVKEALRRGLGPRRTRVATTVAPESEPGSAPAPAAQAEQPAPLAVA